MRLIGLKDKLRYNRVVVSIASGNPLVDSSGTSKVILRDRDVFLAAGKSYLLLFPVCTAFGGDVESPRYIDFRSYGMVVDESFVGIFTESEIKDEFDSLFSYGYCFDALHVHHLIRNDLQRTLRLLSVFDVTRVVIYLHDYYLICPEALNLIDGEGGLCPLVLSGCCESCPKKAGKGRRLSEIKEFLNKLNAWVVAIAPSEVPARLWKDYGALPIDEVVVLPHQEMRGEFYGNRSLMDATHRMSVGFVGAQRVAKGWSLWKRLIEETPRGLYDFMQFGAGPETSGLFTQIPVFTHEQGKNAMIVALRNEGLAVALLLSNWPETYSYTAFECFASGSYIVTLENSGNIANMVKNYRCGFVCKNEDELMGLLADKARLVGLVNAYRTSGIARPSKLVDSEKILTYAGGEYALERAKMAARDKSSLLDPVFAAAASALYKRKYASL